MSVNFFKTIGSIRTFHIHVPNDCSTIHQSVHISSIFCIYGVKKFIRSLACKSEVIGKESGVCMCVMKWERQHIKGC